MRAGRSSSSSSIFNSWRGSKADPVPFSLFVGSSTLHIWSFPPTSLRACQIWAPKSWGLRIPFAQPLTGGTPDHRKGLIRSPLSPQLPGPGSPRAPKSTAWGSHESRIPSLTRPPHCRGHCPDATLFLRDLLQPFPTQLCRTAPQTDAKYKTHT